MTGLIPLLNNLINQTLSFESDQSSDSFLIANGLLAIAGLAIPVLINVGLNLKQRRDDYVYKQMVLRSPENLDKLKGEEIDSSILPNKVNEESLLHLEANEEIFEENLPTASSSSSQETVSEKPAPREMTRAEAKEKYSELTKEHKEISLKIKDIKKKLNSLPRNEASKNALSDQLNKAKNEEKVLDAKIKHAYRIGYGEAIREHADRRK